MVTHQRDILKKATIPILDRQPMAATETPA
jgi:hypothetical protein